jgi:hypothetical protein
MWFRYGGGTAPPPTQPPIIEKIPFVCTMVKEIIHRLRRLAQINLREKIALIYPAGMSCGVERRNTAGGASITG